MTVIKSTYPNHTHVVIFLITLLVVSVTSQVVEFDPSINDTINIDLSQEFIVLDIVRTGDDQGNTTITYNITSTSSVVPFSNPSGVLLFVEDSVQTINLTLINNDTLEIEDEYFIQLHVNGNVKLGNRSTIRIVILLATICFNESSMSVVESQESLIFKIMISDPSSTDMTITVVTTDGTAAGCDDYEPGPFNVTIPAGKISVPFNISIIDDDIFEANESFTLTIDSSSLPSRVSVQPDCVLIIKIVDDDASAINVTSVNKNDTNTDSGSSLANGIIAGTFTAIVLLVLVSATIVLTVYCSCKYCNGKKADKDNSNEQIELPQRNPSYCEGDDYAEET